MRQSTDAREGGRRTLGSFGRDCPGFSEGQLFLDKLVAELATETRRGFDQVAAQFRETGEHFREVKERFRETDERFRPQTSSFAQPMNGSIKWYRQLAS